MWRISLVVVMLALAGAAWVQAALEPPVRGIVTITASYGQFYTNLGAKERLCPGAELLILRPGGLLARARVLKVNMLDSIAQLAPEFSAVIPQAGDAVAVQFNPDTPTVRGLHPPLMPGTVGANCRPPALPAIEPDMDFVDDESDLTLALLILLGVQLLN